MSLKTELQGAIDYCNTALVNKGVNEASTVYEIGDMIDTIQTGSSDELIATITQATSARSMKVTLPDIDYTQYSAIYVKGKINLSSTDWVYLNNTVDTATGNVWFSANNGASGGSVKYSSLDFDNMVFHPYPLFYGDNGNFYCYGIYNRNITSMLTVTNREFYFVSYTSSVNILDTSQLKIYGVR